MTDEQLRAALRQAMLAPGTYAPGETTMRKRVDALMPVVQRATADEVRRLAGALRETATDDVSRSIHSARDILTMAASLLDARATELDGRTP